MVRQEFAEVHDTHRCARAASGRGRTARLLLHSIMLVEFRFTLLSLWAAYIQSYRHTRGLGNNERGLRNNERGRKNRSPNKGYIVNFSCGVIRSFNCSRTTVVDSQLFAVHQSQEHCNIPLLMKTLLLYDTGLSWLL